MNRMRAKNQHQIPSEVDAKDKLIVYVYEYLTHCGAKNAAMTFLREIQCEKDIQINESPGFLSNWWCVFWDLYCAAPDKRNLLPECSSEARALIDMRHVMSPACSQTPPLHPQQQQQQQQQMSYMGAGGGGPNPMGPRYSHVPHSGHIRAAPNSGRLQGPPPPPIHMVPHSPYTQVMGSPRHTPQMHGPSPIGDQQQMGGQMMPMGAGRPGPPPPQQQWQPQQVNYTTMSSPIPQAGGSMLGPPGGGGVPVPHGGDMGQMMMADNVMMDVKNDSTQDPPTPQSQDDPYVMSGYQDSDQNETAEILKVKQSLQEQTKQQNFGGDYNDFEPKVWQ